MLIELEDGDVDPIAPTWADTAWHVAWIAWLWFVGASVVGFWLVVAATVWLDARPVGRVVIEWGTPLRGERVEGRE